MPWRLPDGTYVSMTDTPNYLKIDIDSLEPQGMIKFDDDIKSQTGTTHVRSLPNGDTVGVVSETISGGKTQLTAYRISKDNINKRIRIGSVPTAKDSYYQHAFGLSEHYVTIFQHPVKNDMGCEIMGRDMLTCMKQYGNENTTIHAIKIDGEDAGQVTSFDTGKFF